MPTYEFLPVNALYIGTQPKAFKSVAHYVVSIIGKAVFSVIH
jgi:hypothetical protein